jgi:hypothetical protein
VAVQIKIDAGAPHSGVDWKNNWFSQWRSGTSTVAGRHIQDRTAGIV